MSPDEKSKSPSANDNNTQNTSPSDQGNKSSKPPSTPSPKTKASEDEFEVIDEEDLPSEPDIVNHSDTYEEPVVVSKEGIPLTEELDQNGKPSAHGGKQQIQRSLGEMNADWERKNGVPLNRKTKKSAKKSKNKADLGEYSSAGGAKDRKGEEEEEEEEEEERERDF